MDSGLQPAGMTARGIVIPAIRWLESNRLFCAFCAFLRLISQTLKFLSLNLTLPFTDYNLPFTRRHLRL